MIIGSKYFKHLSYGVAVGCAEVDVFEGVGVGIGIGRVTGGRVITGLVVEGTLVEELLFLLDEDELNEVGFLENDEDDDEEEELFLLDEDEL